MIESALYNRTIVKPSSDDVYDDGYLRVEHKNFYLACNGCPVYLPRTEFLLISCLVRSVDRVVAAEDLWRCAREADKPFNAESLHVFMYRLRRKLLAHNVRIDTVVNVGYRLVATQIAKQPRTEYLKLD